MHIKTTIIAAALAGIVSTSAASACPCSLGAVAAGFKAMTGLLTDPVYPWQMQDGGEYQGASTLPGSSSREFGSNNTANSSVAYPVNAFALPAGNDWDQVYHRDSVATTWNGPGGKVLSQAQMNTTIRSALASGGHVTQVNRPTGWTASGLPNVIGNKIETGGGNSLTYSVHTTAKWSSQIVPHNR